MKHSLPTLRALVLCAFVLSLASVGCQSQEPATKPAQAEPELYLVPELGGVGLCQSPINVHSWEAQEGHHEIRAMYRASKQHIVHKGHTIELEYDEGSEVVVDGKTYEFRQFHFHTPSEHLVDGVTYPLEMHLVHTLKGDPEVYLVIAVLFREGPQPNSFLGAFLDAVPDEPGAEVVREATIDVRQLQDGKRHYYTYQGSLTTPPYTESVTWGVVSRIRTASPAQITRLQRLEGNNARHVQPLHGRTLEGK
jgi:carbonic anhydrase